MHFITSIDITHNNHTSQRAGSRTPLFAEVVFQPPSLWPEGIGLFPSALLYPVQHSEPSTELAQGTAKTQASRQEIPDLCSAPG